MEKFSQFRDRGMLDIFSSMKKASVESDLTCFHRLWHRAFPSHPNRTSGPLPTFPYIPLLLSAPVAHRGLSDILPGPPMAAYWVPRKEGFSVVYIGYSKHLVD